MRFTPKFIRWALSAIACDLTTTLWSIWSSAIGISKAERLSSRQIAQTPRGWLEESPRAATVDAMCLVIEIHQKAENYALVQNSTRISFLVRKVFFIISFLWCSISVQKDLKTWNIGCTPDADCWLHVRQLYFKCPCLVPASTLKSAHIVSWWKAFPLDLTKLRRLTLLIVFSCGDLLPANRNCLVCV